MVNKKRDKHKDPRAKDESTYRRFEQVRAPRVRLVLYPRCRAMLWPGGSMDFCILGLLTIREMSLYDLNQAFARYLGLFYSASLGSLQITLRKLVAKGLAEVAHEVTTGRKKRLYRITAAGTAAFCRIMESELPETRLEETILARLYFLGLVYDPSERLRILKLMTETIRRSLDGLEATRAGLPSASALPEDIRDVARFQMLTLEYGLAAYRSALVWFEDLVRHESEKAPMAD